MKILEYLVAYLKTIYFNFHYFKFKTAIHLPVFIYPGTYLRRMSGRVKIEGQIAMKMIKIGSHRAGIIDPKFSRSIWEVTGTIVFKGKAIIGSGTKISVAQNAIVTFGDRFLATGRSEIISQKEITFGNNNLLSWDNLIMDTDYHKIIDNNGERINEPRSIKFGNDVWIGCRCTILKGTEIKNNSIISATTTISKKIDEANCIIGGQGKNLSIIKRDIDWEP